MTDRYLQGMLKNWAAQHKPPEDIRSRLLLSASNQSNPLEESHTYLFEEQYARLTDLYEP